jgi:hypothetical protein
LPLLVDLGGGPEARLAAFGRIDADVADALELAVDEDVDGVAVDDVDEGGGDGAGNASGAGARAGGKRGQREREDD